MGRSQGATMRTALIFIGICQFLFPYLKFLASGKHYLIETKERNNGNGNHKFTKTQPTLAKKVGRDIERLEDNQNEHESIELYPESYPLDDDLMPGVCHGTDWCHANAAKQNRFICKSGDQCIYNSARCNGYKNCKDGSDENNCRDWCQANAAKQDRFICKSGDQCIGNFDRCDGYPDCKDVSDEDETNCSDWCHAKSGIFCEMYGVTECLGKSNRCDGDSECDDESDEANCSDWCKANSAEEDRFICATGDHCVQKSERCDGHSDCKDGSDEASCTEN